MIPYPQFRVTPISRDPLHNSFVANHLAALSDLEVVTESQAPYSSGGAAHVLRNNPYAYVINNPPTRIDPTGLVDRKCQPWDHLYCQGFCVVMGGSYTGECVIRVTQTAGYITFTCWCTCLFPRPGGGKRKPKPKPTPGRTTQLGGDCVAQCVEKFLGANGPDFGGMALVLFGCCVARCAATGHPLP